MRFNEIKILNEAQFNSKQEVIDHFVKQGKSAAAGASAWERGWRGSKPKPKKPTGPVRSYHDDLDDKRYGETNEDNDPCWDGYKRKPGTKKYTPGSCEKIEEAAIGTAPKRPARPGTRPARGHNPVERYKKHVSPDGVETNMSPEDDDYQINYGPGGAVAKDRNARGVDVATGTHSVSETTGVTDYNPKSQGGTRKELLAKYHKTKDPKDAEAARKAGATQKELQGVKEGTVYDLEKEYGYEKPKHKPRRSAPSDYPYTPEEDDAYFREIFRKKREAAKKAEAEKEQVKEHKKGVIARKYSTKPKGTVNHLDPKKLKKVPGRKVVGPKNIKDLEKDLHEARVEYNKKTARMEINNGDTDDRHGLYLNGKLVKTYSTKEQAENMKKRSPMYKDATIKKIAESIMKQPKQQIMIEGYTEEDLIGPVPVCEFCGCHDHTSLDESGKAKRSLCLSSKPDAELGASQLSSCKAQGLRARAGGKSHKIGKSRVKVGGHRIKGKKYGGPLPDWS